MKKHLLLFCTAVAAVTLVLTLVSCGGRRGAKGNEGSADTVYVVSAAGELASRWVKTPSAVEMSIDARRYSGLRLETDHYAFFAATTGITDNMGYKIDKTTGAVTRTYLYDANLDHVSTRNNRIITPPVNTGRLAMPYQPLHLIKWLEEGKLSGELATLAATLKEDDNPVLLISKN